LKFLPAGEGLAALLLHLRNAADQPRNFQVLAIDMRLLLLQRLLPLLLGLVLLSYLLLLPLRQLDLLIQFLYTRPQLIPSRGTLSVLRFLEPALQLLDLLLHLFVLVAEFVVLLVVLFVAVDAV
jgi:hypothetical protein